MLVPHLLELASANLQSGFHLASDSHSNSFIENCKSTKCCHVREGSVCILDSPASTGKRIVVGSCCIFHFIYLSLVYVYKYLIIDLALMTLLCLLMHVQSAREDFENNFMVRTYWVPLLKFFLFFVRPFSRHLHGCKNNWLVSCLGFIDRSNHFLKISKMWDGTRWRKVWRLSLVGLMLLRYLNFQFFFCRPIIMILIRLCVCIVTDNLSLGLFFIPHAPARGI